MADGPSEGGAGLSEAQLLAAFALHADQDDRRSSSSSVATASSGAGTSYFTCTAGSWGDAGSLRSLSGSFSHAPRRLHSATSGSPSVSPNGSPPKRSPLGGGPRGPASPPVAPPVAQPPAAAPAPASGLAGEEWQQLAAYAQRSPSSSLTLRERYQQYAALATGSSQEQRPEGAAEGGEQPDGAAAAMPQELPASAAAEAGPSAAAGTGLRSRRTTAAGREHSVTWGASPAPPARPSMAAPPPPPRPTLRRATIAAFAPADPGMDPSSLAAAGAAAAAAMQQQLAAGEEVRRAAAAAAEDRRAAETLRGSIGAARWHPTGEDGLDKVAEEGQQGGGGTDGGDGGKAVGVECSDGDELALSDLGDGQQAGPWYRRLGWWAGAVSIAISLAFYVAGTVMVVTRPDETLANFAVWRWCFFLGCWPPIYYATRATMWALTKFAECRLFSARTAVYFLVGTRGALLLVMRSCLVLVAFAALFQSQPDKDEDGGVQTAFKYILRVLGCVVLFTVANLIKKVLIKLMAAHLHREAHFQRMQEALRKEYFLSVLSQPREPHDSMADGADGAALLRGRSFAKRWLSRQALSRGVGMMHALPTMVRSFSRRAPLAPTEPSELAASASQEGELLPQGSEPSDAASVGAYGLSPQKSHRSSSAAQLTSISVVVGAGVEPSSRSAPNLAAQQAPLPRSSVSFGPRGWPARPGGAQPLQLSPSRLSRSPGVSRTPQADLGLASDAAEAAAAAAAGSGADTPSLLPCQLSPSAAAIAAAAAAAAQPELRRSLASHRDTMASSVPGSFSFAAPAPAHQRSLGSAASGGGRASRRARDGRASLATLIDLGTSPRELRKQSRRRTSIVQLPPEELQKMHQIERHIRKNQLKLTLVEQLNIKGGRDGGSNEQEARRVAYFLFHNLRASRRRAWIQQSDLEDFLPPAQAEEAFRYLDIDGNGQISQAEVRDSVAKIFQERAFLARTLRDTKSVIAKLERLLGALLHVLFVFFYLFIWGVDVSQAWLSFSSVVLAFTFIFGNSIRNVFESVIWLFAVHPYDVGDTLVIGGENHRVEEIALLNTVLVRWDGARLWFPNARLNAESLLNLTRSNNKAESFKLSLDLGTPLEVVEMLRDTVAAHVAEHTAEFTGASSVVVKALGDPMKLSLSIWYEYAHNGVDGGRVSRARSGLYLVVASALTAAHVQFTLPPFAGEGEPASARAHAALEAQEALAVGMGLPPPGAQPPLRA